MDPSATALMHDIGVILDDFKSDMVEHHKSYFIENGAILKTLAQAQSVTRLVIATEEKVDDLSKEIKGLFSSSYSFNK